MQQSKVITLFRDFNKDEWKHFGAFVQSPYFNTSEKLARFYKLLETHHPLFDSPKLQKEKLYKALHSLPRQGGGNKAYNDTTMRELISDLLKLAKTFLAHEQLNNKSLEASVLRYEWLFAHHNEKLATAELELRSTMLDDYLQHDRTYYRHRAFYDFHKFEMADEHFKDMEHKMFKDHDIFAHIHAANREHVVKSLSFHIYILSISDLYIFTPDEAMTQQVEMLAVQYINKGDFVIDLLYNIFQLLRTGGEACFFEGKARLLQNYPEVSPGVVQESGVILSNYCARRIREGENRFAPEVMQIFRFEVENNFHLRNGKLNYALYFNITVRGIETNDLDWLENFIEDNKKYLPEEFQEDTYNCSKAHVLFARKKYKEAIGYALSCNITIFVVKILIRHLVARIHYELGMLDELEVELETHRHHLKDEKLTGDRRQHLQTFITVMRQLAGLKRSYNKQKLEALSAQVDAEKGFANRSWFQEKIEELKDRHKRVQNV